MVADKAATIAAAPVDVDRKQWNIECWDVLDGAKLDDMSLENEADGTNANYGHAAAVSQGDS